jgi:hypothetical protein
VALTSFTHRRIDEEIIHPGFRPFAGMTERTLPSRDRVASGTSFAVFCACEAGP